MSVVNVEYIDSLVAQIEAVNTCEKLQEVAAKALESLNAQLADMQAKLDEFAPLIELLTAPTDPQKVIAWIQKLIDKVIRPMTLPVAGYQAQITAQIAAVARLTTAISNKASEFTNCSIVP